MGPSCRSWSNAEVRFSLGNYILQEIPQASVTFLCPFLSNMHCSSLFLPVLSIGVAYKDVEASPNLN